jgi:hypothetical protein
MSQSLILIDVLFLLDVGRRREIAMGEQGFLRAGHALLAVPQVEPVRFN